MNRWIDLLGARHASLSSSMHGVSKSQVQSIMIMKVGFCYSMLHADCKNMLQSNATHACIYGVAFCWYGVNIPSVFGNACMHAVVHADISKIRSRMCSDPSDAVLKQYHRTDQMHLYIYTRRFSAFIPNEKSIRHSGVMWRVMLWALRVLKQRDRTVPIASSYMHVLRSTRVLIRVN